MLFYNQFSEYFSLKPNFNPKIFLKKRKTGALPITNVEMTRFNISLNDGVEMVLNAMKSAWGGELFVPKIPSYKITDVASAIGPNCEQKIVGIRPGEKIHEEMITASDSFTTYDLGKYYAILPQIPVWDLNDFIKHFNAKQVKEGFTYNSGTNTEWVSIQELRLLIKTHVETNFEI